MSEQVVVIFKVLGRFGGLRPKEGKNGSRWDLVIQPMMELPKP